MYDCLVSCWRIGTDRVAFQHLRVWFSNRAASVTKKARGDTLHWDELLRRLHRVRNTRPRRRTIVQQFMLEYPDEVKKALVEEHENCKNLTSGQRLNLQNDVAKTLLYKSYAHLIPELEDTVKEEQEAGMAEWNLTLKDINVAEDVTQYDLSPSVSGHL